MGSFCLWRKPKRIARNQAGWYNENKYDFIDGKKVILLDKRVTRIYFTVLLIGIVYSIFVSVSYQSNIYTRLGDSKVITWKDEMEMTREGDVYCYKMTLPENDTEDKVIVYNTVHMYLEVQIEDRTVYELKPCEDSLIKTTGFCWNVISLTGGASGKEISFRVTPAYNDSRPRGNFLYGTYQEVEHKILKDRIFRLILAGMIAIAGIVLLFYGSFVVREGQVAETIMQFAIFATMLGVWSVCETQILDLFFPCSMVIVFVSHLMLMIMPIPFVMFLSQMYRNGKTKLLDICCGFNCAVIIARIFLQITGLFDLKETLFLTHICLLLFVISVVMMSVHEIKVNGLTRQIKVNSICVLLILVSTVLELGIFRFSNMSTPLGSIGFLVYIVVMGIENVSKSRKLMEQARESEIYRKLAFTDELTGLYNRTAFKEDLEKRVITDEVTKNEIILPTVIFMFDLNDLKKCNDTYGHDFGDQYIKMAADVLKKAFAEDERCYRLGGDEFCAWSPNVSLDKINKKLRLIEQQVKEQSRKDFVVTFSMAVGYAVYKETEDSNLYSTLKRADAMMYEKKQEYKRRRSEGLA